MVSVSFLSLHFSTANMYEESHKFLMFECGKRKNQALFLRNKIKVHRKVPKLVHIFCFSGYNVHEHLCSGLRFLFTPGCVTLLLTCSLPWVVMRTPRPRTSRRFWRASVLRPMTHVWTRYLITRLGVVAAAFISAAFHFLWSHHKFFLSTGHLGAQWEERE